METLVLQLLGFIVFVILALVIGLNGKWLEEGDGGMPLPKGNKKLIKKTIPPAHSPRSFSQSHLSGASFKKLSTEVVSLTSLHFFENVRSSSELDVVYTVSGGRQTCTCPNFEKRKHFPMNDMRRWCKHLIAQMIDNRAFDGVSDIDKIVLSSGWGGGAFFIYEYKHPELPVMFFTVGESNEWLNILARQKRPGETVWQASGEYARFGWSCYGRRWSYGEGVPGASKIRLFLRHIEELSDLEKYAEKAE